MFDDATMTTALTVSQIQALLASTPEAYDIIPLVAPPASYDAGVNAAFLTRNLPGGTTTYDGAGSGALLQGGFDDVVGEEDFDAFYFYSYTLAVNVPSPSTGLGPTGRLKVAEGNSPLPRDRAYFHYGLFGNAAVGASRTELQRFTPGFEKTFGHDLFSLEMRFPFAASLDSQQVGGPGGLIGHDAEFGNLAVYLKALLWFNSRWVFSAGLGATAPTAEDVQLRLADGTPLVQIQNESVHLQPFFAGIYAPNDRLFVQGFLQFDVDCNGNSVLVNPGGGLQPAGRLNDATYLFADLGIGYWLYQSSTRHLTGIAPTLELHYNTSLQAADYTTAGGLLVGNFGDHVETLNLTVGSTFAFGDRAHLTVGYITPLGAADRQLDGGLRALFDYYPGGRR